MIVLDVVPKDRIHIKLVQATHNSIVEVLRSQSTQPHIPVQTNAVIERNVRQAWTGLALGSREGPRTKRRDILTEFEIHNVLVLIHDERFAVP